MPSNPLLIASSMRIQQGVFKKRIPRYDRQKLNIQRYQFVNKNIHVQA
ncbi:hypothetical protein ACFOGG_13055 [Brenneria rubrifaciens]